MLNYQFKIQNKKTSEFIVINDLVTDPNNFYALQDYPKFDVDIKNSEVQKEGQHGIWDFYSFYGKRVINFSGVIIGTAESNVETLKKKLIEIISLPPIPSIDNDGTVIISWTDANSDEWQIECKLQSTPNFDRNFRQGYKLDFSITFKAKNPQIESQDLLEESGIRGWPQGSVILPTILPTPIDIAYNQSFSVDNAGSIPTSTIITLYGETGGITNPTILNITTGKSFKVNTVLADATKYISINSKTGSVVNQDGNDLSGLIDSSSEYIFLNVGVNELVYMSDENPNITFVAPTAQVDVSYRKAII